MNKLPWSAQEEVNTHQYIIPSCENMYRGHKWCALIRNKAEITPGDERSSFEGVQFESAIQAQELASAKALGQEALAVCS